MASPTQNRQGSATVRWTVSLAVSLLVSLGLAACAEPNAELDTESKSALEATSCELGVVEACQASVDVPGACSAGQRVCEQWDGQEPSWGACSPAPRSPEVCGDGVDNDCDGVVDQGCGDEWFEMVDVDGEGSPQAAGENLGDGNDGPQGEPGDQGDCASGVVSGGCEAPTDECRDAEICDNGLDDDCNGQIDEGCEAPHECELGQVRACTGSCGGQGQQTCQAGFHWGGCEMGPEVCHNGVDDNCNGQVDEGCATETHNCRDNQPWDCNVDPGYGDHCDAGSNTNGCSADVFWAWCNRRHAGFDNLWPNAIHDWVADHCDGTVTAHDNTYTCVDSYGDDWSCKTPLVVVFDPAGDVEFASGDDAATFPLDPSDHSRWEHDWPTAVTPWLALDRNGNGRIDDGSELFGSSTVLRNGDTARDGFEALADLDDNRDGIIDHRDELWPRLMLWRDDDGDQRSQPAELSTVAATGLEDLSLTYRAEPRCDARGNCGIERAQMHWHDASGRARQGALVDVHILHRRPVGERRVSAADLGRR